MNCPYMHAFALVRLPQHARKAQHGGDQAARDDVRRGTTSTAYTEVSGRVCCQEGQHLADVAAQVSCWQPGVQQGTAPHPQGLRMAGTL